MKLLIAKAIAYENGAFSGLADVVRQTGSTKYDLRQEGNLFGTLKIMDKPMHDTFSIDEIFLDKGLQRRVNAGLGTCLLQGLAAAAREAGYKQLAILSTRNYILMRLAYEKLSYAAEYIWFGRNGYVLKTGFDKQKWFQNENVMVETALPQTYLLYSYEGGFMPQTGESRKIEAFFQSDKILFRDKKTDCFLDPGQIFRIEIVSVPYGDIIIPLNNLNFPD